MPEDRSPNYWLRIARLFRDITQAELAKASGVERQTIIHLEAPRSHTTPTRATKTCLALALGYQVGDIWHSGAQIAPDELRRFSEEVLPERLHQTAAGRPPSWLRVARTLRGMTQQELADASGVARSTIMQLESAGHEIVPRATTRVCLAAALGYGEEDLWPARGESPSEELRRFIRQRLATLR
jgi:transcriptional regulator with XRE-family HTH domain